MTIDRIETLLSQFIADQDGVSRDDHSFQHNVVEAYFDSLQHALSVPDLSRSASGGTPRLISTAPRLEVAERDHAIETDASGFAITDILPFDHEFSESGWDRNTAMFAGAAFATVSGAPLFGPVSAKPIGSADASGSARGVNDAPTPSREDIFDINNFRTLVGHHAMLWYAHTFPGLPSSSFGASRGLTSGYSFETLFEIACVQMIVAKIVEAVNPRARFSVSERGDVVIMRAENWAARNMFRAYSGLIRAKMAKAFDTAVLVEAAELDS